jgi:hypothetical protein
VAAPELAVAKIKRFCHERTPAELRDEMRLEVEVRGNSVTIVDCRPLFHGEPGDWTRMKIAQLRFDPADATWALYWADRNSRWHRYNGVDATKILDDVLAEIDDDPTCIFFG